MRRRGIPLGLVAADVLALAISAAALVASCVIISRKKLFWNDELYSWYFLADPSFSHMWAAFNDQINTTPPLYFVIGWVWAQVVGPSELSLRLFSSLSFALAMVLVWATLRRAYGFWPTGIGTLAVFLTSRIVLLQIAEARMYGLFMALSAALVYQYVILNTRGGYTRKDLVVMSVLHAALVNTHMLGLFYSLAVLAAYVTTDLPRRTPRKGVYAAVAVGWLTLFVYLPAFLTHADVANPRAWLPRPRPRDFFELVGLASPAFVNVRFVSLLVLCLVLIYALGTGMSRAEEQAPAASRAERSLLVMAFALLAVPAVAFVFSRTIQPIFWERYMVPTIMAYSIFIAHLTARYLGSLPLPPSARASTSGWRNAARFLTPRGVLLGLAVVLWAHLLLYASEYRPGFLPGAFDHVFGYEDLPIVVTSSGAFLERAHYGPEKERYFFILDEEAAMSEESGQFGPQEYKHMVAFKRQYPALVGSRILRSDHFLSRFDRFLVIDGPDYDAICPERVRGGLQDARTWTRIHCPQWVRMRLLENPAFEVTHVGTLWDQAFLLVQRTRAREPTSPSRPGDGPASARQGGA